MPVRPISSSRSCRRASALIAAAFYPKPVIVRLSDFKTNEYARLLGGEAFEPKEENPMLGFRGASRYAHPAYAAGFALECAALRRVREDMGLTNLRIMVPFCRRVEEARRVLDAMAQPRSQARRERARDLCHVRDPQQRDPDRCICRAVRRIFDRLQRPDPADAGRRSRFGDRRLRFRRARSGHAGNVAARGEWRQAQRTPCRHLRRGAGQLSRNRPLPCPARNQLDQRQSVQHLCERCRRSARPSLAPGQPVRHPWRPSKLPQMENATAVIR